MEKLNNACCKACDANSVYNEGSETLIYSLTQGVAVLQSFSAQCGIQMKAQQVK